MIFSSVLVSVSPSYFLANGRGSKLKGSSENNIPKSNTSNLPGLKFDRMKMNQIKKPMTHHKRLKAITNNANN